MVRPRAETNLDTFGGEGFVLWECPGESNPVALRGRGALLRRVLTGVDRIPPDSRGQSAVDRPESFRGRRPSPLSLHPASSPSAKNPRTWMKTNDRLPLNDIIQVSRVLNY